jgi:hypothetical protein
VRLLRLLSAGALVLACGACSIGGGDKKTYRVPSAGMEPTIHCGRPAPGCLADVDDRLVVDTSAERLERGDIIAFRTPPRAFRACGSKGVYVKRVVGLPGETVSERTGGLVYVDGGSGTSQRAGETTASSAGGTFPTGSTSSSVTTVPSPATHAAGARCRRRTSSGASSRSSTEAEPVAAR